MIGTRLLAFLGTLGACFLAGGLRAALREETALPGRVCSWGALLVFTAAMILGFVNPAWHRVTGWAAALAALTAASYYQRIGAPRVARWYWSAAALFLAASMAARLMFRGHL